MTSPSMSTRLWQAASTSPAAAGICAGSLTSSRGGLQDSAHARMLMRSGVGVCHGSKHTARCQVCKTHCGSYCNCNLPEQAESSAAKANGEASLCNTKPFLSTST